MNTSAHPSAPVRDKDIAEQARPGHQKGLMSQAIPERCSEARASCGDYCRVFQGSRKFLDRARPPHRLIGADGKWTDNNALVRACQEIRV